MEVKNELKQYRLNKLNIISNVKKVGDYFKVTSLEFKRIITAEEANHTLPVSTFLQCIKSFFTESKDFLQASNDFLSIFSKTKQNYRYYTCIKESLKKLEKPMLLYKEKSPLQDEPNPLCREQLKIFLEDELIPFVFFTWNERKTSVYYERRTSSEKGCEGLEVKLVNKRFRELLNNTPNNLEDFKRSIEEIQNEFFGTVDLPAIIKIGCTDQEEVKNNISKYLKRRFDIMATSVDNIIRGDILKQLKNPSFYDNEEIIEDFSKQLEHLSISSDTLMENILPKLFESLSLEDFDGIKNMLLKTSQSTSERYNDKMYEERLARYKNIKDSYEGRKILEFVNKLKAKQEFKNVIKSHSKSSTEIEKHLDKIINLYKENEEIKYDLNKLKLDLINTLQILENHETSIDIINTIARDDLNSIIYDSRKLFQALVYILELNRPYDYQKEEDYVDFLNGFFDKSNFIGRLIDNKPGIERRLDELAELILQDPDEQSELSFNYANISSNNVSMSTNNTDGSKESINNRDVFQNSHSLSGQEKGFGLPVFNLPENDTIEGDDHLGKEGNAIENRIPLAEKDMDGNCYFSPEDSCNLLEQVSNSSKRNEMQNSSLQHDACEEEEYSSSKPQSNDSKHNSDVSDDSSSSRSSGSSELSDMSQNDIINSCVDSSGRTILHLFTRINHYYAVRDLIQSGTNVNVKDNKGYTPLHYAAEKDYYKITKILMEKGADITVKNVDGYTPFNMAKKNSSHECIQLLESQVQLDSDDSLLSYERRTRKKSC